MNRPNLSDDLYFIRARSGQVKIGRSCSVERRFATLRLMSPVPLELLGVLAELGEEEAAWHAAFFADRLHGEWFKWSEEMAGAIQIALDGGDWRVALRRNIDLSLARSAQRLPRPLVERVRQPRVVSFTERRKLRIEAKRRGAL